MISVVSGSSAIIISISLISRFKTLPSLAIASVCCCKTCPKKNDRSFNQSTCIMTILRRHFSTQEWSQIDVHNKVDSHLLHISKTLFMYSGWSWKRNKTTSTKRICLDTGYSSQVLYPARQLCSRSFQLEFHLLVSGFNQCRMNRKKSQRVRNVPV